MHETSPTWTSHEKGIYGYASHSTDPVGVKGVQLPEQTELIAAECERLRLRLLQVVIDREPAGSRGHARPGLEYVLKRLAEGDGGGLIVCHLSRLTRSVVELGEILEWFLMRETRLVSIAEEIDTAERSGLVAVRTLVGVSGHERLRVAARTRPGLEAARGHDRPPRRPAVADDDTLSRRIQEMRRERMTLQEIADRLNAEGVPTVRGGAEWRPSSLQSITGYRRRSPALPWQSWEEEPRPADKDSV